MILPDPMYLDVKIPPKVGAVLHRTQPFRREGVDASVAYRRHRVGAGNVSAPTVAGLSSNPNS